MRIVTKDLKDLKTNTSLGMRKQKIIRLETEVDQEDVRENIHLLEQCRTYWESLRDFRDRRRRNRRYYRGDQWGDLVKDPDSVSDDYITESDYIKRQGKVPLKQNQIRQLVKNLIGQYRSNPSKSIVIARQRDDASLSDMLSNAIEYASQINMAGELDARLFEEYALSGAPIQKIGYKYWKERNQEDVYIENVNPNRMFFNSDVSDIRLKDLRLVGEIIDAPLDEVISTFAKSRADQERIRNLYRGVYEKDLYRREGLTADTLDHLDFYIPADLNKARVLEVWYLVGETKTYAHDPLDGSYDIVDYTLKEIAQQNRDRLIFYKEQGYEEEEIPLIEAEEKYEQIWKVKYLTPHGHTLWEGETPYAHEEHPYAITLYPLLDGEVWGFIEDVIDQQRYINRLIILMDFMMSASAKGVLLVPEDVIPDGMTPDDFAKEWTRFNGIIVYKPNKEHLQLPKQISSNSTNAGVKDLLAIQMQLLQEISGVHSAIQGMDAKSGTPSSLYAQEAQNATINTLDYMETFSSFRKKRDMKMLQVITQFYKEKRFLAINGRSFEYDTMVFDPEKVRDLSYDIVVTQGKDTPVYRQLIDDTLMTLLEQQFIDLEMFLEHTSLPIAQKLLQSVKARNQEMTEEQAGVVPEDMVNQVNQQANPQAVELLKKMVKG